MLEKSRFPQFYQKLTSARGRNWGVFLFNDYDRLSERMGVAEGTADLNLVLKNSAADDPTFFVR